MQTDSFTGLVAAPAVGAFQEGGKGFAKGAALGIAGAVALPLAGVGTAVVQVGRGLANTPEAIREAIKKEKTWDHDQRRWIKDPGNALAVDDRKGVRAARQRWCREQRARSSAPMAPGTGAAAGPPCGHALFAGPRPSGGCVAKPRVVAAEDQEGEGSCTWLS